MHTQWSRNDLHIYMHIKCNPNRFRLYYNHLGVSIGPILGDGTGLDIGRVGGKLRLGGGRILECNNNKSHKYIFIIILLCRVC